jgi:hypothetical protein
MKKTHLETEYIRQQFERE